jgi:hypothetical protein
MLRPQLCMGIQPGARFPARSADALLATLYAHFTEAIYRNRPTLSIFIIRHLGVFEVSSGIYRVTSGTRLFKVKLESTLV